MNIAKMTYLYVLEDIWSKNNANYYENGRGKVIIDRYRTNRSICFAIDTAETRVNYIFTLIIELDNETKDRLNTKE